MPNYPASSLSLTLSGSARPTVVASPVGMDDGILARFQCLDCRIQHLIDKISVRGCSNRPRDWKPVKAVNNRRQIHLSSRDGEFRDVRQPFLIRRIRMEIALYLVRDRRGDLALIGVVFPLPYACDSEPVLFS